MPRPRKHPLEWTNEEVLRKLFPPEVRKHLKRAVKDATKSAERKVEKAEQRATKRKDTP